MPLMQKDRQQNTHTRSQRFTCIDRRALRQTRLKERLSRTVRVRLVLETKCGARENRSIDIKLWSQSQPHRIGSQACKAGNKASRNRLNLFLLVQKPRNKKTRKQDYIVRAVCALLIATKRLRVVRSVRLKIRPKTIFSRD